MLYFLHSLFALLLLLYVTSNSNNNNHSGNNGPHKKKHTTVRVCVCKIINVTLINYAHKKCLNGNLSTPKVCQPPPRSIGLAIGSFGQKQKKHTHLAKKRVYKLRSYQNTRQQQL